MNVITLSHTNQSFLRSYSNSIFNFNCNYTKPISLLHNYNHKTKKRDFSIAICNPSCCSTSTIVEAQTKPTGTSESRPRRLILLRHAQSSTDDPSLKDHDRPLSKAGQDDAINVSQKLQQLGWLPQLILSSDALRTQQTLKIMQEHVPELLEAEVHFISSFYSIAAMDGQTAQHLELAICKYSTDDMVTVMCMGHNRGWEEAASMFSGSSIELKSCNAALLETTGRSWEEAFALAGPGGWNLHAIVKPNSSV